jgi:hypothetical protein
VETTSTPAANNVNLLAETVILNYMALHNQTNLFDTAGYFPTHGLGNATMIDSLIAFNSIANGQISPAPPNSCPVP